MAELCTPKDIELGYYNFKCNHCGHIGSSRSLGWRATLNPKFSPYFCPRYLSTDIINMSKFLIFGGAFDPIHREHLLKISKALDILKYDKALIMPTYKSMFGKEMSPASQRRDMIRCSLNDYHDTRLKLCTFEIDNQVTGGTFKVMLQFKEAHPEISNNYMAYVIGSDQAVVINKWVRWESLLKLLPFVVITRNIDEKIPAVFFKKPHRVLSIKTCPLSSSTVRDAIKRGINPVGLITENTLKYIQEHKLYV